jgi:hypothetical protein
MTTPLEAMKQAQSCLEYLSLHAVMRDETGASTNPDAAVDECIGVLQAAIAAAESAEPVYLHLKGAVLTDAEIWKFWWNKPEVPEGEDDSMEAEFVASVRRVLAAHGIKEQK